MTTQLPYIREVIVVEGKNDITAVKRAVQATCITTQGWRLGPKLLRQLQQIQKRLGIIVLMDPDTVGESLRRKIKKAIPQAKHAFISKKQATNQDNIGVENAPPEVIRDALIKARGCVRESPTQVFSMADLLANGLAGGPLAAKRREDMARILGIGYANAKNFLERLNCFGVTREAFEKALLSLGD